MSQCWTPTTGHVELQNPTGAMRVGCVGPCQVAAPPSLVLPTPQAGRPLNARHPTCTCSPVPTTRSPARTPGAWAFFLRVGGDVGLGLQGGHASQGNSHPCPPGCAEPAQCSWFGWACIWHGSCQASQSPSAPPPGRGDPAGPAVLSADGCRAWWRERVLCALSMTTHEGRHTPPLGVSPPQSPPAPKRAQCWGQLDPLCTWGQTWAVRGPLGQSLY